MIVGLDEFKKTTEYNNFIKDNPDMGTLKVQAFTAYGAIPVSETEILISKVVGDERVLFFRGFTDSSGIISDIKLPAPYPNEDINLEEEPMYTTYDLTAIHEGYETIKRYKIAMFGEVRIIQYVKMNPEVVVSEDVNNED